MTALYEQTGDTDICMNCQSFQGLAENETGICQNAASDHYQHVMGIDPLRRAGTKRARAS
jgi:hypothetical protein